ncbi:MAG: DUF1648 domain-containing protein [Gemmatimonadales bacterium]
MRSRWLLLVIGVVAALASALLWSRLPAEVPTHWNVQGEPDGWSPRIVAALMLPLMIAGLALVLRVVRTMKSSSTLTGPWVTDSVCSSASSTSPY